MLVMGVAFTCPLEYFGQTRNHCFSGVIAIVAIVVVIFVILIRRGHLQPVQRGIMRAGTIVARKTRQSLDSQQMTKAHTNHAYDVSIT